MISFIFTACMALKTDNSFLRQMQTKLPQATYQWRCVEDKTMGWTFVFVRASGCSLKGSSVAITTETHDHVKK